MTSVATGVRVPIFDARREYDALATQLIDAAERVLSSGSYILGEEVEAFEREIAAYLGARHAAGVASGTDAIWLALKAAGIGPGDGVLTTPFTFFATASAIINAGAEPVFADVEPRTMTLDPEKVREVLEGRSPVMRRLGIPPESVRALVPVHIFGQPADMGSLGAIASEYKLALIEDAAQAIGAEFSGQSAGTVGDFGCFSFFPTKNLGGFGDGGLVTTDDDGHAERLRLLRAHGSRRKYHHEIVGTNSRLDSLQAGLLRVRLRHLDAAISSRRAHAAAYDSALASSDRIETPVMAPGRVHVYHQYAIQLRSGSREELRTRLNQRGIQTEVHYPVPLHLQNALSTKGYRAGDFPVAEVICSRVISLPMFPTLTTSERSLVVNALIEATSQAAGGSETV